MRAARLEAARQGLQGRQVMDIAPLAARLAGGFGSAVDPETLREVVANALTSTALDDLDRVKDLPGMVGAAAGTLTQAWNAALDLQGRAHEHPRIATMARLDEAVLRALPVE